MKSENILLSFCVGFVSLVVLGLTIQSCRTTNQQNKVKMNEETSSCSFSRVEDNSSALASLIHSKENAFTVIVRDYSLVRDSVGNVSSALTRETELSRTSKEVRDSSNMASQTQSTLINDSSYAKRDVFSRSEKESKPPDCGLITFSAILVFIGVLVFFIRKKIRL
ncbi:hypothetical protein [uncultured Bacteroides sp.]|uniref:hypothetical protein n=1 Tax=uncultured Bacteroides sp. TaxID=162156 RepID=UPI002595ECBE|nr:hypothetical protein [uncultured Bacteroides sp.]